MRQTEYTLLVGVEATRGVTRARFPTAALKHIGANPGDTVVLIIEGELGGRVIVDCKVLSTSGGPHGVVGGSGEPGLRERVAELERRVTTLEKGGLPDEQT